MNDDVKAAVEKLREAFEFDRKRCDNDTAESLWRDELLILAHIDGEPARIAAACEEVREACARHIWAMSRRPTAEELMEMVGFARSTPLTATPLADEIAALRARVAELEHQREGMLMGGVTTEARQQLERAEKAEAERDALRARVDALYGVELLARALAESEPMVSGYVRLCGRVVHLSEIHALARAAVEAAK